MRSLKPGRGPPPDHIATIISDFQPLELWEIKFLLFVIYIVYVILLQLSEWTMTLMETGINEWIWYVLGAGRVNRSGVIVNISNQWIKCR